MKGIGRRSRGELDGFLDAGSRMHGELGFDDTFRVDGHFSGKVSSEGDLVVGEQGVVEGEIRVARLFVTGTVLGSVRAARRIEVSPGGRVQADIDTPILVIEEGGFFQGRCSMERPAEAPAPRPVVVGLHPHPSGSPSAS